MTDRYMTVQHLADLFHKDPKTIRRWIEEERKIMLGETYFEPHKDPAGHWLFKVVVIKITAVGSR